MAITIDLYHQSRRLTGKVRDEWAEALLATKFETAKVASAKNRPELLLGGRSVTTQAASAIDRAIAKFETAFTHTLTLPSLRDGPLPLPQGERAFYPIRPNAEA